MASLSAAMSVDKLWISEDARLFAEVGWNRDILVCT